MSEDKNRFPELVNPVLPKRGLVYQESNPQLVLCKVRIYRIECEYHWHTQEFVHGGFISFSF